MSNQASSRATRDIAYHLHPYTDLAAHEQTGPLVITRGDGVYVYDEEGNAYLDALAGVWCTSLGFSEKRLADAATRQLNRLPYYPAFAHRTADIVVDLAETLIELTPASLAKAFFVNSGAEANETHIKLIWLYNNTLGRPAKKKIISRRLSFHGATLATASMTGMPNAHACFDLPLDRFLHVDCPHYWRDGRPGETEEAFAGRMVDRIEALIMAEGPDTIAAFVAEPVQAAAGVVLPPTTYFERLQDVLRRHDILFVVDEVVTGFCRTGNMFASDTYNLRPDHLSLAKGLTSAYLPLAAALISDDVYRVAREGTAGVGLFAHGHTHSGNPVGAAVALEAIKIYEERNLAAHTRHVGARLIEGLRRFADHPLVGDVRGVGLLAGVEMIKDKVNRTPFDAALKIGALLYERALAHRLMVRQCPGDTVAFCPPLIVTEADVDEIVSRFGAALEDTWTMVRRRGLI